MQFSENIFYLCHKTSEMIIWACVAAVLSNTAEVCSHTPPHQIEKNPRKFQFIVTFTY